MEDGGQGYPRSIENGGLRGLPAFRRLSMMQSADEYIVVARTVRVRGLRGELVAEMLTDFPERFDAVTTLTLIDDNNRVGETVTLENHWFQKGRVILKLQGVDSIEAAEPFVNYRLAVHESDAVELAADEFYEWQLVGCQVETVDGADVGQVVGVMRTGGIPVLEIKAAHRQSEILIPLAETICVEVDTESKRITIDPPEGLLEL